MPAGSSASAALPWREVIAAKLEAGLTAQRIYQDLLGDDHGYTGSYYSVRRLVRKLSSAIPAPFRRMECEAGAEAKVDLGRGAPIVNADGKRKSTWVFRIVLSHRRKGDSEAVVRQAHRRLMLGFLPITACERKLITQRKLAKNQSDEVYDASQHWPVLTAPRWLVLNAVIAHIKWLGLKRQMTGLNWMPLRAIPFPGQNLSNQDRTTQTPNARNCASSEPIITIAGKAD